MSITFISLKGAKTRVSVEDIDAYWGTGDRAVVSTRHGGTFASEESVEDFERRLLGALTIEQRLEEVRAEIKAADAEIAQAAAPAKGGDEAVDPVWVADRARQYGLFAEGLVVASELAHEHGLSVFGRELSRLAEGEKS